MKLEVVQIGKYYALRKWSWFWLSYRYLDLENPEFTWGKESEYFMDCLTMNKNHPEFLRATKDQKV